MRAGSRRITLQKGGGNGPAGAYTNSRGVSAVGIVQESVSPSKPEGVGHRGTRGQEDRASRVNSRRDVRRAAWSGVARARAGPLPTRMRENSHCERELFTGASRVAASVTYGRRLGSVPCASVSRTARPLSSASRSTASRDSLQGRYGGRCASFFTRASARRTRSAGRRSDSCTSFKRRPFRSRAWAPLHRPGAYTGRRRFAGAIASRAPAGRRR